MKAIYVRTSTDDNDGAAQLHELRQWCERERWRNVREYVDKGESGKKDSRPQWDKLRADIRKGKIKEVAATQLSRLGRTVVNVILALDELRRLGCRVVLLRENLDYETPIGRAIATILAAVAALEHEQITQRIRAGVRRAQECGTRSGRAIGRPKRKVSEELKRDVIRRRAQEISWSKISRDMKIPETTLRRLVACQNPA